MIIPSLKPLEEQLRGTTSTFSTEDWNDNKETLSRIRALTSEPRKSAQVLPKRDFVEDSAKSLPELLSLPINGRSSSGETEPVPPTLHSEPEIMEHCNNEGMKSRAIAVAKAVFRSLDQPKEIYTNVWNGSGFYQTEGTTARRLLEAHDSIVNEGHINGARYRINALVLACLYHARVQGLGPKARRETIILEELMKESSKPRSHITTVLKRGRWYALWVSRLGLGAILTLGESFASSNHMQDIDHLVNVCRAICGFCERSQEMSGLARRAIEQAIFLSDDARDKPTAIGSDQRYIDYPATSALPPNDQNGSVMSGIADRQIYTLPPPARFQKPGPAISTQQDEDGLNLHPQPDSDFVRPQVTIAETAPMTGQRHVGYLGTTGTSADGEVESAILGIDGCQPLNSLPSNQVHSEQTAAEVPTAASCRTQDPASLGRQSGDGPHWQPNRELTQQQETCARIASFRPSPNANSGMRPVPAEVNEVFLQPRAETYPGFQPQTCFTADQGCDVGDGFDFLWNTSFAF